MEQDVKVLRKAKITKILLGILIAFSFLSALGSFLAGDFKVLISAVVLVVVLAVVIFYINKKNNCRVSNR